MESPDINVCNLPSDKYYSNFDAVVTTQNLENSCNSYEELLSKYPVIREICLKLSSNLESLKEKEKEKFNDIKKRCTYLKIWMQDKVIKAVQGNNSITYIGFLYKVWSDISDKHKLPNIDECNIGFPTISIDDLQKWKKMKDYDLNYEVLHSAFKNNEECIEDCIESCEHCEKCMFNCKEAYCTYFSDIFNIFKEFHQICSPGTQNIRCPKFWKDFEKNYLATSDIESQCKEVYKNLGFYKVKVSLGNEGEETYVEQYETTYIFSFFEKLIGYSLSFFGSKIAPKADDMRKMWRNVQGVTNPATLLNPMKPPGGGNKIGLPYMPK
ncbi:PIR Superfamily Protein [Plasmodium ovale curtisi]|uniref:PIR Superfamily Protein n=2 Tax=Plasmodium ovale curtisi TaxID=864141 RepID=A0A1A8WG74_PLAOA|nr:PIR Superfamily Protein [Plasmodium ovale curtisi]